MLRTDIIVVLALAASVLGALSGCSAIHQDPDQALIRQPGNRAYDAATDVHESARELWEYAVMSDDVYARSWYTPNCPPPLPAPGEREPPPPSPDAWDRACKDPSAKHQLPLPGWRRWAAFPSTELAIDAGKKGLYVEVWQRNTGPREVAVVFQGTNDWLDWLSNFRWFRRIIPGVEDQYTVISSQVGKEFVGRFPQEMPGVTRDNESEVTIVATGHSLGGGLATHFAYSLPPSDGAFVPRVTKVYGFDPSPVTGWYTVDRTLRTANAEHLAIVRVFEHGEILAYARLLLRYLNPPPAVSPSVKEIRYNFDPSINPLHGHEMRLLACALAGASHQTPLPADTARRMMLRR